MKPDIRELRRFFREAEATTYANKMPKETVTGLPGLRVMRYEKNVLLYLDTNISSPSRRRFAGTKVIYWQGAPIWVMQYHGFWRCTDRERATLFLRKALQRPQSLGNPLFIGWRGPAVYREDSLLYHNTLLRNEPDHVHGEETLYDTSKREGSVLFDSEYIGFSL